MWGERAHARCKCPCQVKMPMPGENVHARWKCLHEVKMSMWSENSHTRWECPRQAKISMNGGMFTRSKNAQARNEILNSLIYFYVKNKYLPVCTRSLICSSDNARNYPFSRETLAVDGKQRPAAIPANPTACNVMDLVNDVQWYVKFLAFFTSGSLWTKEFTQINSHAITKWTHSLVF